MHSTSARFFNSLMRSGLALVNGPTGTTGRIIACSCDANLADALSTLDAAISRADNAVEPDKVSKTADAFYCWNFLCGSSFPADSSRMLTQPHARREQFCCSNHNFGPRSIERLSLITPTKSGVGGACGCGRCTRLSSTNRDRSRSKRTFSPDSGLSTIERTKGRK
jgi:hypothetical protein